MKRSILLVLLSILLVPAVQGGAAEVPITLKGSPASMVRQNQVATELGYPFVETYSELRKLVAHGELVTLRGNADYTFREGVTSGVARPEMRLFIERLAAQYHEATGEKLVVTSLTRPSASQPKNAHALSVHPAGIAVDLRVSQRAGSRQWLESALLGLERKGLLDITRERWPPHYHVALFPEVYLSHVEAMIGPEALAAALTGTAQTESAEKTDPAEAQEEPELEVQEATLVPLADDGPNNKTARWPLLALAALIAGAAHLRRRWKTCEEH